MRRTVADVAVDDDQRGLVGRLQGFVVAAGKIQQVVGVADAGDVPAVADEARHHVFAERPACRAVERHAIVVVNPAKIRKLQMASERGRFTGDAFHQVAIAADRVNTKIEKIEPRLVVSGAEPFGGDGHADAVGDTLAKRAGGGFDAGGDVRFRMSGSAAIELAEILDVVEGNAGFIKDFALGVRLADSGEMQRRVQQHRGMASGENEAIAIGPQRGGRVVGQKIVPERINDGGEAHGRAGMARIGFLHCIDGKSADGIDTEKIKIRLGHDGSMADLGVSADWLQAYKAVPAEKSKALYCKLEHLGCSQVTPRSWPAVETGMRRGENYFRANSGVVTGASMAHVSSPGR